MGELLGRLSTDLGERSTYDASSQCSRCGYCEQACPTYKATGDETRSPRGRNQLVRLLLEGKLEERASARRALETCLLCSACSTACFAHVPTADIVLEGRRLLADRPWAGRALSRLLLRRRPLFELLLRCANLAKRSGLSRLARPFLRLAGLRGLALADEHVRRAPRRFSPELLSEQLPASGRGAEGRPKFLQFLPCGTRYLFTEVALATRRALSSRGGSRPLNSGCCGLLAYNYGELSDAREFARQVISQAEAAAQAEASLVVDCSSCAAFLKSYPQLFLGDPFWKARAEKFASRVRDAVEVFDEPAARAGAGVVTYHESCRACHGQGLKAPSRLLSGFSAFRPLEESDSCCGGAGAFSLLEPELSEAVLRRKIERIARTGARLVVTSSTSCLLQLAHGLRKYYPSCEVRHVSEVAAAHGSTTGA
ncbi:MAG: (Fe-S)-binding protein [Elusimicrobia bacterium]|nr:(Fe-S)-binding protein [Elusimicrobiota bacterium]MDE2236519.1 (Fe-S)-binding protein [Elusimicrobiota bacterium]MDE2425155.1 (Fe-S)-binding protein [Elusimicrobiota bacterium]